MPIMGFNFTKITAERKSFTKAKIEVKSNIKVEDVKEEKLPLAKDENGLRFDFSFVLTYEPKIGEISFTGNILYVDSENKIKKVLKEWKKNKKIPPELNTPIINTILYRCNLKAIELSQEVNLPPQIQMPRIKPQSSAGTYIG